MAMATQMEANDGSLEAKHEDLQDALTDFYERGSYSQQKIGTWLKASKDRIFGGLKLCSEYDKRSKQNIWFVKKV